MGAAFNHVLEAKVVSTRVSLEVATGILAVGGAHATAPELGLDRYWRDARTHTLHDAVRTKPFTIGRWELTGDLADPWTLGHPFVSPVSQQLATGQKV